MAAFFGMATKYAEGLLAIRYRTKDDNGHISGGPMYYILHGMGEKWRPLAIFFAVAGVLVALFGIGTMTQVNSITGSLQASFGTAPEVASVVIALVVSTIIFGGIHWISKVSEKKWFLLWLLPISLRLSRSFSCIWTIASSLKIGLFGCFYRDCSHGRFRRSNGQNSYPKRGGAWVFSNESGLGSAPIAAAAAEDQ